MPYGQRVTGRRKGGFLLLVKVRSVNSMHVCAWEEVKLGADMLLWRCLMLHEEF